ncbi:SPOR domain-containing protein [Pseudoxanthomonas koreensis]|uniref:SPOR domain-containing protein n=1 Tax=Pseudoxanthomonas koreensis TaxID=266061 RepID=UPI00139077F4|nr:SPOR domain-containing protein [Pseudoxanthomonas koreensis]KAF1691120.1 sporulation protein [Pseudoxanthomonas koreensis]
MDTTLKQRLIGGAVLVALAVIFLPMLVQGPAPDSGVGDVSTRVPATPGGEYETRELPLLGPDRAGELVLPAPAATTSTATPATGAPAAAAAPERTDPAVAAGQWAVSFGAYASARDADAVLSRLRQAGLDGFREEATLNGRQAWRVRVGPYPDRALAEAGRLQAVRIRNDVNAQVIALDAVADAAATPAAGSTPSPAAAASTARVPATSPPVARQPASSQSVATSAAPATRTEALPPDPAPARPAAAAPKPAATAQQGPPVPAKATPAAAVPAASSAPAASGVGFAVQMGAFASAAEANALRDRLRAAGYSAIVQPVSTDKGTLNRVRVGPVSSRAEADQLKARLAGGFGAGMVVPHP